MHKIYRFFAIASAIAILAAMIAVGFFYHRNAVTNLTAAAESHNVVLAQILSNTVLPEYFPYIGSVTGLDGDALRARPETRRIDRAMRRVMRNLSVLKVKIYDAAGLTIYSSEAMQIGEKKSEKAQHAAFFVASKEGKPQSKLSFRDRFSAFSGEVFNRDVVETYVPMRNDSGRIVGVFELYSDVTETKDMIDHTVVSMAVGLSIVFLVLYGTLVFVIMRRAIAPLRLASERAAAIGPHALGVRLPTKRMPDEILPLIEAVNDALRRLDTALENQRRFAADAAHELLTPLAVLTANADTLEDKRIAKVLRTDIDAMSEIVTQLLELAEAEALNPAQDATADPRDACVKVISSMAPLAYQQGKELALTGSERPARVRCSPEALSRAVGNLVKNALIHTPAGTCVEVDLRDDGTIRVIDRGPGVPAPDREFIFRRFWRGRDRSKPGAGLGLSIVKQIADVYGGRIDVDDAPAGGAVFSLHLPAAEKE